MNEGKDQGLTMASALWRCSCSLRLCVCAALQMQRSSRSWTFTFTWSSSACSSEAFWECWAARLICSWTSSLEKKNKEIKIKKDQQEKSLCFPDSAPFFKASFLLDRTKTDIQNTKIIIYRLIDDSDHFSVKL